LAAAIVATTNNPQEKGKTGGGCVVEEWFLPFIVRSKCNLIQRKFLENMDKYLVKIISHLKKY